jgi:hypothetical protein
VHFLGVEYGDMMKPFIYTKDFTMWGRATLELMKSKEALWEGM